MEENGALATVCEPELSGTPRKHLHKDLEGGWDRDSCRLASQGHLVAVTWTSQLRKLHGNGCQEGWKD